MNGRLTLGENLADLGGVNIAYEAFMKTKQFKEGKKIDGVDLRLLNVSFSVTHRSGEVIFCRRKQAQRLLTDPHSPAIARANEPLRNIDAWYDAFNVKEGDKMYKPSDKRIRIW